MPTKLCVRGSEALNLLGNYMVDWLDVKTESFSAIE